ncbi:MAG: class I SAM-dependent methyltransferase [Kofleriaceae bacterium]
MAELVNIECPLCANASSFIDVRVPPADGNIRNYGVLYEGLELSRWKVCGRCGFVHQNPRPSIEALNRFYLAGDYHPKKIDLAPDAVYASHAHGYEDEIEYAIEKSGLSSGSVFDVGCGFGVALAMFQKRGWTSYGVEPDPSRAAFGKEHFGLANVRAGVLDGAFDLGRTVDLVFTHHAFEHFADLPDVMRSITKLLRPGGFMFTAIPTYRENRSTMSKLWMNSAHYSLFSHHSFDQLLARYGFERVAYRYNPWNAGPDQLGHLARYTGVPTAPERHYEDPQEVARYLDVINPIRSRVYLPLIGGYRGYRWHFQRAAAYARGVAKMLVTNPDEFLAKAASKFRR